LWTDLAAAYDKIGDGVVGVRPHVSLAVFAGEGPGAPSALVARLARLEPFSIALDEVDVFSGKEGVVFLRPSDSDELRAAHATCTRALGSETGLVHPYYHAKYWVPHCTMAIGVPESSMNVVLQRCREAVPFGTVGVHRISFVRYRPTAELHTANLGADQAV
jgi:2'-5' RNA ligase